MIGTGIYNQRMDIYISLRYRRDISIYQIVNCIFRFVCILCLFQVGLAALMDFIFASIHINENFNCTLETRQMVFNNDIFVKYLFHHEMSLL